MPEFRWGHEQVRVDVNMHRSNMPMYTCMRLNMHMYTNVECYAAVICGLEVHMYLFCSVFRCIFPLCAPSSM